MSAPIPAAITTATTNGATPLTLDVPATSPGDVLAAIIAAEATGTISQSEWTQDSTQAEWVDAGDGPGRLAVFYRTSLGAGEPASYQFTNSLTKKDHAGAMINVTGADAAAVIAGRATVNNQTTTSPALGTFLVVRPDTLVLGCVGSGPGSTHTPPAGYAELVELSFGTIQLAISSMAQAAAGVVPATTAGLLLLVGSGTRHFGIHSPIILTQIYDVQRSAVFVPGAGEAETFSPGGRVVASFVAGAVAAQTET